MIQENGQVSLYYLLATEVKMDNNQESILAKHYGNEATISCYDKCVVKTYKHRYFRYNRIYNRKGEAFFLEKYKSPYFASLLGVSPNAIILPNYGEIIAVSRKNMKLKQLGLDYLELTRWISGLRAELSRLQLLHRDISPKNILYDKRSNKYVLIDFSWAIAKSDLEKEGKQPEILNHTYAKSDDEAFDKISIEAVQTLLSKIGAEKHYDGSNLKVGWVYHPIPFPEFSVPVHKTAAVSEYEEVLKYCEINNHSSLNILEIGSSIGYFSFKLAQLGNTMTAVEADPDVWAAAEAIRTFKNFENVKFINARLNSEILSGLGNNFDLTIMLNVHMWIHKQLGSEHTAALMKQLSKKTKRLIFQTAGAKSKGMYRVSELTDNETIKIYLEHCGFSNVVHLRDTRRHGGTRALFTANGNI